MIAAPVTTKGGGGALLPAVVGFCVPVRRDSIEGRRLRRTRARCCYTTPPAPGWGMVPRYSRICWDCVRFSGPAPPAEESR